MIRADLLGFPVYQTIRLGFSRIRRYFHSSGPAERPVYPYPIGLTNAYASA